MPVVATNVGALPEMVEEGVTGFLVEPKDDQSLAERFARLCSNRDLARQFGQAGRAVVEREYSLDAMLQRYAELYLSVLKPERNYRENQSCLHQERRRRRDFAG